MNTPLVRRVSIRKILQLARIFKKKSQKILKLIRPEYYNVVVRAPLHWLYNVKTIWGCPDGVGYPNVSLKWLKFCSKKIIIWMKVLNFGGSNKFYFLIAIIYEWTSIQLRIEKILWELVEKLTQYKLIYDNDK